MISRSPRPAWRAAAARGLRSAAGSASRARLAAQNRPALRLPSPWLATHRARWLRSRPGSGCGWGRAACRWGSSRAVTAAQSRPPSAVDCADELVGLAVDLGRRGQDVAAAGAEVQVVGGQVAVALVGAAEVGVQAAAGRAHVGAAAPSSSPAVGQLANAAYPFPAGPCWSTSRTSGPGAPVAMARFQSRVAAEPGGDLARVGGGVAVGRAGWRGSSGRPGRGTPASRGRRRPGPGGASRRSWHAPGLAVGRCGVAGVAAAVGLGAELVGQGGQDAGLVFGLGGEQAGAAGGLQVQHRPQLGQRCPGRTGTGRGRASRGRGRRPGGRSRAGRPARPRPAAGRWVPAGRRPSASTRPVPVLGGSRRRPRPVWLGAVSWPSAAACSCTTRPMLAAWPVSSASWPLSRGVMVGFAGVEAGELLGVGGELVDDGGDRVVAGHGQLQGKEVPSPGSHSAGT